MLDHDQDIAARQDKPAYLAPAILQLRLIVLALAMGLGIFTSVALYLVHAGNGPLMGAADNLLTIILLGAAVGTLLMQFVVPSLVYGARRQLLAKQPSVTRQQLLLAFQVRLVVGCALCEGAGFMAAMAYLMEGHFAALPFIAVALLLILIRLPSSDGLASWLDREEEWLRDQREMQQIT